MNGPLFIDLGVVPILIGPLQVFLAMLPAILLGLGSALLALFKPATWVFSNGGAIYCLDADIGGVVWKCAPEGFRATFSSPAVFGKYLVTGEGLHQVKDGRVLCLDRDRCISADRDPECSAAQTSLPSLLKSPAAVTTTLRLRDRPQ